jgi:hypothetical protein
MDHHVGAMFDPRIDPLGFGREIQRNAPLNTINIVAPSRSVIRFSWLIPGNHRMTDLKRL